MTEDRQDGVCRATGKVCYSQRSAGTITHQYKGRRHGKDIRQNKRPVRYYYCKECGCYHLTSHKKKRTGAVVDLTVLRGEYDY